MRTSLPTVRLFGLCALLTFSSAATAMAQGRGPSTTEERARVVKMAAESEKDPIRVWAQEDRDWFIKWLTEVPDISLEVGKVALWCSDSMKEDLKPLFLYQFMKSAVAFQIQNPAMAKDPEATDLAGLEGVLRAYSNLLAKDPKARSKKLDEALAMKDKGELPGFVKKLRSLK